jgi:hypothetical protein
MGVFIKGVYCSVVVQVGAVKIYVIAVKALREKERQDETQFTTKIDGKTSLGPSYRKIFARGILLVMRMMMMMPMLRDFAKEICARDL